MVSKPRCAPTGAAPILLLIALAAPGAASAAPQDDSKPDIVVTLTGGQRPLLRLAIPAAGRRGALGAEGAAAMSEVETTVRADLEASRIFLIQGAAELAVLELTGDEARDRELYRSLGNEVVLAMDLAQEPGGKLVLEGRVNDLDSGQTVLGKRYSGELALARRIAHSLADEIIQYFSQQPGIALSTIAFVSDRQAPYEQKEIYLMDYDGWNQRPITAHRSLSLAPDWSPDGQLLAYVTYVRGSPGIFVADFQRRGEKRALVTDGTLNSSPSFAPDGRRFALTRSTGASAEIYAADIDGGMRQLTYSPGIDTSPAWSPSGREIAFTSSRSGSPQIYVMDSEGANLRRISTQGSYNDGAAWSPDGTRLVYASRRGGTFNIAVTDLVTLETSLVTDGRSSDESPVYSPDGRKIAFSSTRSYGSRRETQIYVVDIDGANLKQLTREGSNYSPAWSRRQK